MKKKDEKWGRVLSNPVDQINYGIHYRKGEKHQSKSNNGKLQSCFCFFHFLAISKSSNIENGCKNYPSDGEYRSNKNELVSNFHYLCLYPSCYAVITWSDRTNWSTSSESRLDTSAVLNGSRRAVWKYWRKREEGNETKNNGRYYFFHGKKGYFKRWIQWQS